MASSVAVSSSADEKKQLKTRLYVGVNLFIKNLHPTISDNRLWEIFSVHGIIISCKVQLDENGVSKGFGFVCFATADQAAAAIAALNGKVICSKPLYVGVFETKEERAKNRLKKAVEYFEPPAENPKSYEEFLQQSLARGRGRGRVLNPTSGRGAGMAAPYIQPLVNPLSSPPHRLSALSDSGLAVGTDASSTPKPATQAAVTPNDDQQLPCNEAQQFNQPVSALLPRFESPSKESQPLGGPSGAVPMVTIPQSMPSGDTLDHNAAYRQAVERHIAGIKSPRSTPSGDAPDFKALYGLDFPRQFPGVTSPRSTPSGDASGRKTLYGLDFPRHVPGVTSPRSTPSADTPDVKALYGQDVPRHFPGVTSPQTMTSGDAPNRNTLYGQGVSWPVPGTEGLPRPPSVGTPDPYASSTRYASVEYISPIVYQARSVSFSASYSAGN